MRDDRDGSEIERYRRSDRTLDTGDPADVSESATVTDIAESLTDRSVTVESESVTATLIGVPRIDVHEYVYDHQLGVDHGPDETRPIAMFDLRNTGEYPVTWRTSRTRFVGTDEYTYQPARLSLDPSRLGPGCHSRQVEIDPNRRARVVTLVEQLPEGVEVAEVVHKLNTYGDSQRLAFSVR